MSTAEAQMRQLAESLPTGTLRHEVLTSARRFKTTWVELGRLLIQVRDQASYEAWGFSSFEAYCLKELHIRKATALKLTRSFSFLDRHEPEQVRDPVSQERAPAFEVVEVLADAEERGQLSADEYASIRDSIWDPDRPPTAVKRELTERFPKPPPPPLPEDLQLKRLAQAARKLARELSEVQGVPPAVAERAGALAEDVEELMASLEPVARA
ncbi:MAG TPA: hypothetical protein VK013_08725 [Myxococcaceae bacterium]|nr:hypothetical protein [Myxococcaceae bacterium]